ncbi:MAG: hypothetical protein FJZ56_03685, partial [Chlamydiae bacterium]|nr:hypothetical protein [Chlamydiota bacterium]
MIASLLSAGTLQYDETLEMPTSPYASSTLKKESHDLFDVLSEKTIDIDAPLNLSAHSPRSLKITKPTNDSLLETSSQDHLIIHKDTRATRKNLENLTASSDLALSLQDEDLNLSFSSEIRVDENAKAFFNSEEVVSSYSPLLSSEISENLYQFEPDEALSSFVQSKIDTSLTKLSELEISYTKDAKIPTQEASSIALLHSKDHPYRDVKEKLQAKQTFDAIENAYKNSLTIKNLVDSKKKLPLMNRQYAKESPLSIKDGLHDDLDLHLQNVRVWSKNSYFELETLPEYELEKVDQSITKPQLHFTSSDANFFQNIVSKEISTDSVDLLSTKMGSYTLESEKTTKIEVDSKDVFLQFQKRVPVKKIKFKEKFDESKNGSSFDLVSKATHFEMRKQKNAFSAKSFPKYAIHAFSSEPAFTNEATIPQVWEKAQAEVVFGTFAQAMLSTTMFNLDPPETKVVSLLSRIAHNGYNALVDKSHLVAQKFGFRFDKNHFSNDQNLFYKTPIEIQNYEKNFFTNDKPQESAKKVISGFDKLVNKLRLPDMIIDPRKPVKLINFDNIIPFNANYQEGVSLLETKSFARQVTVQENAKEKNRIHRSTANYLLSLPNLHDLNTESLSSDFIIDPEVAYLKKEDGYTFSLNLSVLENRAKSQLRHHIYYLIDRSSSVEPHRFEVFKNAVANALYFIDDAHLFNIFMFDNSVSYLTPNDLLPAKQNFKAAKEFLDKQYQPWLSSDTSMLDLISILHEEAEKSDDLFSVIILTNGSGLKNIHEQKEALKKIVNTPKSNFFIHAAVAGTKNNNTMLELLSGISGGSLIKSQTHAAFARKLAILTKQIQKPVLKDLKITVVDGNNEVQILENQKVGHYLVKNHPTSFVGLAKELTDFDVIIQGKSSEGWINIRKHIDLRKAQETKSKLEAQ